jgi:alkaline phosphatase D
MAFVSCANWESGYYTAYKRLAEEQPDLILHLGDYIYENAPVPGVVRRHEGDEAITLADYRQRYAQYKTDPDLQAAHLIAPWVVAPDDHEVEDNYAGLARADDYPHLTTGQFRARRAAAYRAYYENMPLRPANSAHGAGMALYRRIRWGRLATFHMLDTRQFRDDQVCGDLIEVCPDADRPDRTITGAAQAAGRPGPAPPRVGPAGPAGVLRRPAERGRGGQHGRLGGLPGRPRPVAAGLGRPERP